MSEFDISGPVERQGRAENTVVQDVERYHQENNITMTDQELERLFTLHPFENYFKDLKDEWKECVDAIAETENECEHLQYQLNRDQEKLYEAEANGNWQMIRKFDQLAARREDSLRGICKLS